MILMEGTGLLFGFGQSWDQGENSIFIEFDFHIHTLDNWGGDINFLPGIPDKEDIWWNFSIGGLF